MDFCVYKGRREEERGGVGSGSISLTTSVLYFSFTGSVGIFFLCNGRLLVSKGLDRS